MKAAKLPLLLLLLLLLRFLYGTAHSRPTHNQRRNTCPCPASTGRVAGSPLRSAFCRRLSLQELRGTTARDNKTSLEGVLPSHLSRLEKRQDETPRPRPAMLASSHHTFYISKNLLHNAQYSNEPQGDPTPTVTKQLLRCLFNSPS